MEAEVILSNCGFFFSFNFLFLDILRMVPGLPMLQAFSRNYNIIIYNIHYSRNTLIIMLISTNNIQSVYITIIVFRSNSTCIAVHIL